MIRITRVLPAGVATVVLLIITVPNLVSGTVMSVRANYADSAPGGGTQYATGRANAQGVFTTTITVSGTASAGNGSLVLLLADVGGTGVPGSRALAVASIRRSSRE